MSTETFIWTDELVEQYQGYRFWYNHKNEVDHLEEEIIKSFKQSKMPKQEERVKVEVYADYMSSLKHNVSDKGFYHKYFMNVYSNELVKGQLSEVQNLIERYLNPTTDTNTVSNVKELERLVEYYEAEFNANSDKIYTQQEVDEMREETWLAARETEYDMDYDNPPIKKKYKELSDYLNSINPENKASTKPFYVPYPETSTNPPTPTEQTKSDVLFTEEQYKEIWDMIFSQTGFPPYHPKTKRNK